MLDFIELQQDVWQRLQTTTKPVVLYGMGNGADKIVDWCENNLVKIDGIFASDDFVRGQSFRGHVVETYAQIKERLGDFLIVIAFASESPVVLANFKELAQKHETVAPHLPLFAGDEVVTLQWLAKHEKDLNEVYHKLADAQSRKVFAAALNYKLSGRIDYLFACETERAKDLQELFTWSEEEVYADLGAYNGDTVKEFLGLTGGKYKEIFAIEPDRRNYKKLKSFIEASELKNITAFERAIWNKVEAVSFSDSGGRQSTVVTDKPITVMGISLDAALGQSASTYIKMDVEGVELEALQGGAEQLQAYEPKLFIAAYHHDNDFFTLPLYLWKLVPEYKIYLRKHPYIPGWEFNFLARK